MVAIGEVVDVFVYKTEYLSVLGAILLLCLYFGAGECGDTRDG